MPTEAPVAGEKGAWVVVQIDRLETRDRPMAAAAAAAVSAYLTIGALSFGVWQEWWLALGALTAATCLALAKSRTSEAAPAAESAPAPVGHPDTLDIGGSEQA